MMNLITPLTVEQEKKVKGNGAISLTLVATVLATAILTIVVWKFYTSSKGTVQLPGGFRFEWGKIKMIPPISIVKGWL